MEQFENYADQRLTGSCIYCGGSPETREHVPSRVFLDKPYPENLHQVEACKACNNGFSLDEEYMACLIDCAISGDVNFSIVQRESIRKTLKHSNALTEKLKNARKNIDGTIVFAVEENRVRRVVEKIAICHALYELNVNMTCYESPSVYFASFSTFSESQIDEFEKPEYQGPAVFPEVGSRAMQRLLIINNNVYDRGWITVQPGRYRYIVTQGDRIEVRLVFSEYLACQVVWEDVV